MDLIALNSVYLIFPSSHAAPNRGGKSFELCVKLIGSRLVGIWCASGLSVYIKSNELSSNLSGPPSGNLTRAAIERLRFNPSIINLVTNQSEPDCDRGRKRVDPGQGCGDFVACFLCQPNSILNGHSCWARLAPIQPVLGVEPIKHQIPTTFFGTPRSRRGSLNFRIVLHRVYCPFLCQTPYFSAPQVDMTGSHAY